MRQWLQTKEVGAFKKSQAQPGPKPTSKSGSLTSEIKGVTDAKTLLSKIFEEKGKRA